MVVEQAREAQATEIALRAQISALEESLELTALEAKRRAEAHDKSSAEVTQMRLTMSVQEAAAEAKIKAAAAASWVM